MLTDDQLIKFQSLWKQRFNQEISKGEALKEGLRIVRLVELICKPNNETEYQKLQQLCNESERQKT